MGHDCSLAASGMRLIMHLSTAKLAAAGRHRQFHRANVGTGASVALSNSNTNVGWLVGAGFEYAFTRIGRRKWNTITLALNDASYNVTLPGTAIVDTFTNGSRNIQTVTARHQLSVQQRLLRLVNNLSLAERSQNQG